MTTENLHAILYGEPTTGHGAARELMARVIADVPTPAQVKAIAYTTRYANRPSRRREGREDFRAGYLAGLEAARLAVCEQSDGFELPEEEAVKALQAAETPNQTGATT